MKNSIISTLAAIALALPLGIGGLTIAAPVTATDANAADQLAPYRGAPRCSTIALWHCDDSVVDFVTGNFRPLFANPARIPDDSDGANQITFDAFADEVFVDRTAFGLRRVLILNYLRAVFPDPYESSDHRDIFPYQGTGFISPKHRMGIEDILEFEEAERFRLADEERANVLRRKVAAFGRECDTPTQYRRPPGRGNSAELRSDWVYEYPDGASVVVTSADQVLSGGEYICSILHVVETRRSGSSINPVTALEREYGDLGGEFDARNLVHHIFRFQPNRDDLGLLYFSAHRLGAVAYQVSPVEPLGSLAEIEDPGDHRTATSVNRDEIVELQEEVTEHEERLLELEPAVARNTQIIEALGNSVGVLSEAITSLAKDTEKNTAGIALAYALDAPGLSFGKRYAITGALGQFRGESAAGFSGTFKASENVLISVGGGFSGSGDSSVNGGKVSATFEW